jgi:hypothetical protein
VIDLQAVIMMTTVYSCLDMQEVAKPVACTGLGSHEDLEAVLESAAHEEEVFYRDFETKQQANMQMVGEWPYFKVRTSPWRAMHDAPAHPSRPESLF